MVITSCKKNIDNSPPSIQILSPSHNSIHQVFHSISVEVQVEDDQKLDYVKFDIVNNEGGVAVSQISRSGLSKKENIHVTLDITNIHLQSGIYFIRIVASDGINKHSEFIEIIIQEIPLKLDRTFIFNQQTFSMDSISSEDIVYPINQFDNFPFLTKANSYFQESLIAFNNPSKLIYIKNNDIENPIIIPIPNDQTINFYNRIHLDPITHHYFITTNSGNIIEIGPNGSSWLNFEITENLKPKLLTTVNNLLLIEEKNSDFSPNTLKTYYKNSGILVSSHFLNFDLIFISPINEDEIILIGNNSQGGIIAKYLINENTIVTLSENLDQINSACQIDSQNYALSFDQVTKTIEISSYTTTTTNNWSLGASNMQYEIVSNSILGINDVSYFNINLATNQLSTMPLTNYHRIELMYNK